MIFHHRICEKYLWEYFLSAAQTHWYSENIDKRDLCMKGNGAVYLLDKEMVVVAGAFIMPRKYSLFSPEVNHWVITCLSFY